MAGLFRVPVRRQQILLVLGDLTILVVSLLLAFVIARFAHFNILFVLDRFTGGSIIYFSVYLLVFFVGQLYELDRRYRESHSFFHIAALVTAAFVVIATLYYAVPYWRIARRVMAIQAPLVAVLIYLWRNAYDIVSRRFVAPRAVLLVGAGDTAQALIRDLQSGYGREYRIAGIVDDDASLAGATVLGVPVLGHTGRIAEIAAEKGIEAIVFSAAFAGASNGHLVRRMLELRTRGVRIYELPTFYMRVTGKVPVRLIEDRWLLFGQDSPGLVVQEKLRLMRLFDYVVAGGALALLSPLILLVAVAIRLTSSGPILYRQERLGLARRPYRLLKFRTMVADAERESGPRWAEAGDSRVTIIGRFLRRARIDEIPQFVNVLRGEMAVIGPRPERAHFVELLEKEIPYYTLRFAVRPGLTGWAQVNHPYGNTVEDAHTKLQYDLFYLQERSFFLDAVIVLKTLQTIVFRPGY